MDIDEQVWMKVPEAAEYFRVPRSRMYELIQRGDIPAVRIGERSIRVDRRAVEHYLTDNRSTGPSSYLKGEVKEDGYMP